MSKRNAMSITDREWPKMTGVKVNRAAERRAEAAKRAELCALLGYPIDCCCSNGELVRFAREAGHAVD